MIADTNLPPAANPRAGHGDVEPINAQRFARRHTDAWLDYEGAQTFGHDRRDLGDEIARSTRQHSVARLSPLLSTQHAATLLTLCCQQAWCKTSRRRIAALLPKENAHEFRLCPH